jgi:hypothetical protein
LPGIDVEELEGDLLTLAHHKTGFERPEGLARDLRTILDLHCVKQVAGGDSGRVDRVAALKMVLRLCADKFKNEQTGLAVKIYFFLLSKEELKDFSLPATLATALLGERQEAIGELLGTTSAGFRGSGAHRLPALLAGELLRHEIEARKIEPVNPLGSSEAGLDPSPSALDARGAIQAIQQAVRHVYHDNAFLLPLASLIVADRPPYYDVSLNFSMSDGPTDDVFLYRMSLAFTAQLTEYVIGYVSSSYLSDSLLVSSPRLTDVRSFATNAERDACHSDHMESVDTVTVMKKRSDGTTFPKGVRLKDVPVEEYPHYLPQHEDPSNAVKLLRADLQTSAAPIRLRLNHESMHKKNGHFCYWVADRPTYVRSLRIDLRSFTPEPSKRNGRLTVQPFMMATSADLALDESGVLDEETDNWLIRGQGFVVVW